MSASSKKKLRAEANAAKLTEKQRAAQKEAAKTKYYTIGFTVVLVALIVVALWVGVSRTIEGKGILERKTTAVTIGSHEISNAELSYFYIDTINNFSSTYGSYAIFYGLDLSQPLNEQVTDEEAGRTWADDFLDTAIANAQSVYALADEAKANGFELPEADAAQIDSVGTSLDMYAMIYGFSSADAYLKAMYGNGANKESYLDYCRLSALASAYSVSYQENLTFTDAEIREADSNAPGVYSSYTFNQYYLLASKFLPEKEEGQEYTDEQKEASVVAAEVAAKEIVSGEITSVEDFNAAIAALEVNAEATETSVAYTNQRYSSINSKIVEWVTSSERKEGDVTYIANTNTVTDEDGNETTTVLGYYLVYYVSTNDNTAPLVNARHILVSFEGGTTENGTTVYSDEEKAAAREAAEALLKEWQSGEATEDSFAALAEENSTDTGSAANGGLYEDIYPGQMVANFNDWCFDEARKPGDTGIVETNYGYHVMYFVGTSALSYRDYLITNDLTTAAMNEWNAALLENAVITEGNTKYIRKDLVVSAN